MVDVVVARVTKRMLLVMMIRHSFGVGPMAHLFYDFRQEIDDPKGVLMRVNQQLILAGIILGL